VNLAVTGKKETRKVLGKKTGVCSVMGGGRGTRKKPRGSPRSETNRKTEDRQSDHLGVGRELRGGLGRKKDIQRDSQKGSL